VTADNVLTFLDQTTFELLRATGRRQLMQGIFLYEHPVDFSAVQQFNRRLGDGLLGRRIERSPLPFGRPRWVASPGPTCEIELPRTQRPRDELMDWADEQAALPVDPEFGPGWRLDAIEFADGSTAISLVISHCIADGGGGIAAVVDAAIGVRRDFGFPKPQSDTRRRALIRDLIQGVRDVPETVRALRSALALRPKSAHTVGDSATVSSSEYDGSETRCVIVPCVALFVDCHQWDARAESLGGNSYSLLAAFAAKLGERMGRRRASDGAVTLVIALNVRESFDDTRAIAMAFANAALDPDIVTEDLTQSRGVIKQARQAALEAPNPALTLMPLIPWLPKSAVKGVVNSLFAYSEDLPVSCSNMGDLPPEGARIDGTDPEYVFIRAVDQNVTKQEMIRSHGQLVIVSGRINGKVTISVEAYQPDAENSKSRLRELAAATLAEFELSGEIT
jgi:hypothetical protein